MLLVECHESIHAIPEGIWDGALSRGELFHSHRFIAAVEDAKVENSRFWYLLFYDDERLVGTAAFSAFEVALDMFIGNNFAVKAIKWLRPRFFQIRILLCGLPVSLGQKNIAVLDPSYAAAIVQATADWMEKTAKREKISHLAAKEFKEGEHLPFEHFVDHGFFRALSIPNMRLDVVWKSWEEYLSSMKHSFRRQIKNSSKKLGKSGSPLSASRSEMAHANDPVLLTVVSPEEVTPERFHALYMHVMQRAETKLELLNIDFFQEFYRRMTADMTLIALVKGEEILGAALLTAAEKQLTFALVGKEKARDAAFDTYFNLIHGIIDYGIQNGYSVIQLGQTSYAAKMRFGGTPVEQYLYFRSRRKLVHAILKRFNPALFPATQLIPIQPFKTRKNGKHTA